MCLHDSLRMQTIFAVFSVRYAYNPQGVHSCVETVDSWIGNIRRGPHRATAKMNKPLYFPSKLLENHTKNQADSWPDGQLLYMTRQKVIPIETRKLCYSKDDRAMRAI